MTKQLEEERIYFSFQLSGYSVSPREVRAEIQGRNLEAEAEAEAIDECCLLAFSPGLAQPACLYNLSRGATTYSELNPSCYLQENKSRKCPTGLVLGIIFMKFSLLK